MRIEAYLFGGVGAFLAVATVVYYFWSGDVVGTACLALSFGLNGMIGYYLYFTARRMNPRPEDLGDADISDGAGELGFFPPYSWWPMPIAAAATVVFLGGAFGYWWVSLLGGTVLIITTLGLLFEYYVDKPFQH